MKKFDLLIHCKEKNKYAHPLDVSAESLKRPTKP